MSASCEVRGAVASITMNNPSVNGLGFDYRRGIALAHGLLEQGLDIKVKGNGGSHGFMPAVKWLSWSLNAVVMVMQPPWTRKPSPVPPP